MHDGKEKKATRLTPRRLIEVTDCFISHVFSFSLSNSLDYLPGKTLVSIDFMELNIILFTCSLGACLDLVLDVHRL